MPGVVGRENRVIYERLKAMQPGDSFSVLVQLPCDPKRLRGCVTHWKSLHPTQRFETGRCPNDPTNYRIWRKA